MQKAYFQSIVDIFYNGDPNHKVLKLSTDHQDIFDDPFK